MPPGDFYKSSKDASRFFFIICMGCREEASFSYARRRRSLSPRRDSRQCALQQQRQLRPKAPLFSLFCFAPKNERLCVVCIFSNILSLKKNSTAQLLSRACAFLFLSLTCCVMCLPGSDGPTSSFFSKFIILRTFIVYW